MLDRNGNTVIPEPLSPEQILEKAGLFKDDAKIAVWAKADVYTMKKLGILLGDDKGYFNPEAPITRQEIAIVINRLLKMLGK